MDRHQFKANIGRLLCISRRSLFILVVIWLLFEGWVSFFGWPRYLVRIAEKCISTDTACISAGEISGGIISGITLKNAAIDFTDSEQRSLSVHADSLTVIIHHRKLFRAQLLPKEIQLDGGSIVFSSPACRSRESEMPLLALHDVNGKLYLSRRNELTGLLTSELANLKLSIALSVKHAVGSALAHGELNRQWLRELEKKLCDAIDRMQSSHLLVQKAAIHATLTADARRPQDFRINFRGDCSQLSMRHLPLYYPKARGSYQQGILTLKQLDFSLGNNDFLSGDCVIDIHRQCLSARLNGSFTPAKILPLVDIAPSALSNAFLPLESPIQLHLSLVNQPLFDWTTCRPSCTLRINGMKLNHLPIDLELTGLSLQNRVLHCHHFQATTPHSTEEFVRGCMTLDLSKNEIEAEIDSTLRPQHFFSYDPHQSAADSVKHESTPVTLHAHLHPSPMAWRLWKLTADFSTERLFLPECELLNCKGVFTIDRGLLDITHLSASLPGIHFNNLTAQAKGDLRTLHGDKMLTLSVQADLRSCTADSPLPRIAARATGEFVFDFGQKTFSMNEITGVVSPPDFHAATADTLGLSPDHPFLWMKSMHEHHNADISLRLLPYHWDNPKESYRYAGHIAMDDCAFMTIPARHVSFDFLATATQTQLRHIIIRPESPGGASELTAESLAVTYAPLEVNFSDLVFCGEPSIITPFFFDADAKKFFQELLEELRWSPESRHELRIHRFRYASLRGPHWELKMDAGLLFQNACYRRLTLPRLSCRLSLNLSDNGSMAIHDIRVTTPAKTLLRGDADIYFKEDTCGDFSFQLPDGGIDLLWLLENTAPALRPHLKDYTIDRNTSLTGTGHFSCGVDSSLSLKGAISAPFFGYKRFGLENISGDISFKDNTLYWNLPSAVFHQGRFSTAGNYSFTKNSGEVMFDASALSCQSLFTTLNCTLPHSIQGNLSTNGHLRFFRNWLNDPLKFYGSATLKLDNADLWRMPMFDTLGTILSTGSLNLFNRRNISDLGKISRLQAELLFLNDQVQVPSFRTNGTIIALQGNGVYSIPTGALDFSVNSEFLRKANVISWLFKPVTWIFNARLTGTAAAPVWKLRPVISNWFTRQTLD